MEQNPANIDIASSNKGEDMYYDCCWRNYSRCPVDAIQLKDDEKIDESFY